jgi:hypothetical protein
MSEKPTLLDRREAIRRVSAMLGGIAFVGGSSLLTACERRASSDAAAFRDFTADEIAYLDEIAETILPETSTPGAKAAQTGAFMALMVKDSYDPKDQRIFRDGLRSIDDETRKAHNVTFMAATPAQRLSVLERLDRVQRAHSIARENAQRKQKGLAPLPPDATPPEGNLSGQRQEAELGGEAGTAQAITAETPAHYFRMIKELALLGYFTSEIGCTQAQRYAETPGRYDPCLPYKAGEKSWAPHA